jgi:hypothetical protein
VKTAILDLPVLSSSLLPDLLDLPVNSRERMRTQKPAPKSPGFTGVVGWVVGAGVYVTVGAAVGA